MKQVVISILILMSVATPTMAMSYQQAREQALFLTDKMAYELNLNEQQYEAAYEINLDYLMDVNSMDDIYSTSWRRRNLDLQYILLDWQYTAFCAASYFFRPIYWSAGNWNFRIYTHYPRHDFFYFHRPVCYSSYRGAHNWRNNGGVSWYAHRTDRFHRPGVTHVGMHDNYHPTPGGVSRPHNTAPVPRGRDNYGRPASTTTGNHKPMGTNWRNEGAQNRGRYNRESSTRKTVTKDNTPQTTNRPSGNIQSQRQPPRGTESQPQMPATTQRPATQQRSVAPRTGTRAPQSNAPQGRGNARMSRR